MKNESLKVAYVSILMYIFGVIIGADLNPFNWILLLRIGVAVLWILLILIKEVEE